ncbi:hypothetical protein tb265_45980 [Gemmatimonadetes bacterium T265]|nr:hypothetical protein tb265_40320 [Gemmatimonadetes bacterium T265]GJG88905.1 hypothetical protein tb265_40860 [Gemmatimonadetes bacterium T265]GJG89417.1 hypothetical protein tb265_45980 [Gemmatimonadetes bacterium T265]
MAATVTERAVHALEIVREEVIAAPIAGVFDAVLAQLGPENETPGTGRMPMVLEAWPGGRWYRDLGDGAGHFWGSVQAIRSPVLLEICGPLFMSYPAVSNVQFRLAEDGGTTRLRFVHRAMGQIAHDLQRVQGWDYIEGGWESLIARVRAAVERVARRDAAHAGSGPA